MTRAAPTETQSRMERAVFLSFAYDCVLIFPYAVVAVLVGSITMIGEIVRGFLLIAVAISSLTTLRRIHRNHTSVYDYGLGKIEQILALCVAVLLAAATALLIYGVLAKSAAENEIGWLNGTAVVLVLVNFLTNVVALPPLLRATRDGDSVIVGTQFRVAVARTVSSGAVVAAVALDQLSRSPDVALWADRIGVAIVVVVNLQAAWQLVQVALPDLVDRTLDETHQRGINRALAAYFDDYDSLEWCRSRRSGSSFEVDVGLGFTAERDFAAIDATVRAIEDRIAAEIEGAQVVVTPRLVGVPTQAPRTPVEAASG